MPRKKATAPAEGAAAEGAAAEAVTPAADAAPASPAGGGRQRLIAAALRLGASKRGLQALGLRELAREAGLNPNTFYRHFDGLEQLSLAIIEELGHELRTNLRGIRRTVKSPLAEATPRTIEYVFDFALRMPEAFIVAVRELHGAMPPVREALQRMIAEVAQEMVEDVQFLDIAPVLDEGPLREISLTVVQQVFYQTLDYIEQPARRGQIVEQTVRFIDRLFAGALLMQAMKVDSLAALQALQAAQKK